VSAAHEDCGESPAAKKSPSLLIPRPLNCSERLPENPLDPPRPRVYLSVEFTCPSLRGDVAIRTLGAIPILILTSACVTAPLEEYAVFRDRYASRGEDPRAAFAEALTRSDWEWQIDGLLMREEASNSKRDEIKPLEDPELQDRVDSILKRLTAATHRPDAPAQAVLCKEEVGAEAMGAGVLLISESELNRWGSDEDGLAWVLAHEMAHNMARHRLRGARFRFEMGLLGEANRVPMAESMYAVVALSRIIETEADALGTYYFLKAGFRREGMNRALQALERNESERLSQEGGKNRLMVSEMTYLLRPTLDGYLSLLREIEKALAPGSKDADLLAFLLRQKTHPPARLRRSTCEAVESFLAGRRPKTECTIARYVFYTTRMARWRRSAQDGEAAK